MNGYDFCLMEMDTWLFSRRLLVGIKKTQAAYGEELVSHIVFISIILTFPPSHFNMIPLSAFMS